MKYLFSPLTIDGEGVRHFEQCAPIICKARMGSIDIWINSLPPNIAWTPGFSSSKDLMEEERLWNIGGFGAGRWWDDWDRKVGFQWCSKSVQALEQQRYQQDFLTRSGRLDLHVWGCRVLALASSMTKTWLVTPVCTIPGNSQSNLS